MHSITASISVTSAREAADFYAAAFGGTLAEFIQTDAGCIHAQIKITAHTSIYLHDTPTTPTGSQIKLCVALHDPDETRKLFAALSEGGEIITALHKPDWAELYGQLRDRYGVIWSLDCGEGEDMP